MGPVLGITFGSVIRDFKLIKYSLVSELLGLLLCAFIGSLFALVLAFSGFFCNDWPTNEMSSRGTTIGLFTGIAIAIPSGAGVALSTLGNNTSSLVG